MKVKVYNLANKDEDGFGIFFIPTIMLDKTRYSTSIYLTWLCFYIEFEFK